MVQPQKEIFAGSLMGDEIFGNGGWVVAAARGSQLNHGVRPRRNLKAKNRKPKAEKYGSGLRDFGLRRPSEAAAALLEGQTLHPVREAFCLRKRCHSVLATAVHDAAGLPFSVRHL